MITIGIPVYNEENFIRYTLNSVVQNLEWINKVIVTDNNSTDNTGTICKEYAEKYEKIVYIRHEKNIGAIKNFEYSLLMADTKYFMWLGGHDCISENYMDNAIAELEKEPDASLVYGQFEKIDRKGKIIEIVDDIYWDELYSDDPFERVFSHVKNMKFNYFFYGVYRTELIKEAYINKIFIGADIITTLRVCELGKFIHNRDIKYFIREVREEYKNDAIKRYKEILGGDLKKLTAINPFKKLLKGYISVLKSTSQKSYISIKKNDWIYETKKNFEQKYGETSSFRIILNLISYRILGLILNDNQLLLLERIIMQ